MWYSRPAPLFCLNQKVVVTDSRMERSTTTMLRVGDWCVNPASGQISRNGETARVEVRTMRLLLCLAEHAGEVVSIDDLLDHVWSDVSVRLPDGHTYECQNGCTDQRTGGRTGRRTRGFFAGFGHRTSGPGDP